jgi:hypothetical protein
VIIEIPIKNDEDYRVVDYSDELSDREIIRDLMDVADFIEESDINN